MYFTVFFQKKKKRFLAIPLFPSHPSFWNIFVLGVLAPWGCNCDCSALHGHLPSTSDFGVNWLKPNQIFSPSPLSLSTWGGSAKLSPNITLSVDEIYFADFPKTPKESSGPMERSWSKYFRPWFVLWLAQTGPERIQLFPKFQNILFLLRKIVLFSSASGHRERVVLTKRTKKSERW